MIYAEPEGPVSRHEDGIRWFTRTTADRVEHTYSTEPRLCQRIHAVRFFTKTIITAEARRKPTPFRGVDEADNWDPIHMHCPGVLCPIET